MSKLITAAILASSSVSVLANTTGSTRVLPEPETAALFAVAAVVGLAARYLKK